MQQLPQDGLMAVIFAPSRARRASTGAVSRFGLGRRGQRAGEHGDFRRGGAVRSLGGQFSRRRHRHQLLTVSHAFHSPLMEPMLDEFEAAASQFQYQRPQIPLVSNLTGRLIGEEPPDAGVLAAAHPQHGAVRARHADAGRAGTACHARGRSHGQPARHGPPLPAGIAGAWLPSLRKGQDDWPSLLDSLSELYVLGAKVDWQGFDRDCRRQRLILPTYPFERERYWFEPTKSPRRSLAASQGPVLHPLLGSRVPSALPTQLFEARLSSHWPKYLVDHQVQGSPVFPAAGYVEQALAAAEQVFGPGPHVLENLSIQQAMFLPEATRGRCRWPSRPSRAAHVPSKPTACRPRAKRKMPAGRCTPPARCAAGRRFRPPTWPRSIWTTCAAAASRRTRTTSSIRTSMRNRGLAYGPAFQSIQNVYRQPIDALAEVRLPAEVQRELAGYHLHPALGDAMFQSASGMVPLEEDGSYSPYTYMPMGVRRVRVLGPASERMYAYSVRRSLDRPPQPGNGRRRPVPAR